MKSFKYIMLFIFSFFLFQLGVSAGVGTCYYEKTVRIGNSPSIVGGTDYGDFLKLKVVMDSSSDVKLYYMAGGEYRLADKSNLFDEIDTFSNENGYYQNRLSGVMMKPDMSNFYKLFQANGNKCPSIIVNNESFSMYFSDEEVCDNATTFCSKASKEELENNVSQEQVKETSSCIQSLTTNRLDQLKGVEFKFITYSDGSKKFCARFRNNNSFNCTKVTADGATVLINDGKEIKTFVLPSDEVSNFFPNASSCPPNFTVYEPFGIQLAQYVLTTDIKKAEDFYQGQTSSGSLEENGEPDDIPNGVQNGALEDGSGNNKHPSDEIYETEISDITLGLVCKSDNLKVPLKYIGWTLSIVKIIIPIIIITLGVLDFMKAVASQKAEELSKAVKTVLLRVIAGIVVFLVPAIINFLFTLVDDWTKYDTAYSECTKCLANPRNC